MLYGGKSGNNNREIHFLKDLIWEGLVLFEYRGLPIAFNVLENCNSLILENLIVQKM